MAPRVVSRVKGRLTGRVKGVGRAAVTTADRGRATGFGRLTAPVKSGGPSHGAVGSGPATGRLATRRAAPPQGQTVTRVAGAVSPEQKVTPLR